MCSLVRFFRRETGKMLTSLPGSNSSRSSLIAPTAPPATEFVVSGDASPILREVHMTPIGSHPAVKAIRPSPCK
jgi:hypothetical protein